MVAKSVLAGTNDGWKAIGLAMAMMMVAGCGLPAAADEIQGDKAAGEVFAQQNCARCHAVGPSGQSPLAVAPPLRQLSARYPLESLYEAFAEGIAVGHSEMPEFEIAPENISNLLAYIQSLPAGTE